MTTKKEDRKTAVEGGVNSRGEPDVIWLQVHGDADPADYDEPADVQNSEVTWCWEPLFDHDVKYVRADLAATKQQECEDRAEAAEAMSSEPGLLRLLVDLRFVLGDNGKRMQNELLEFARELAADARRYRWLRDSLLVGDDLQSLADMPDPKNADEFDAAIDTAMQCDKD